MPQLTTSDPGVPDYGGLGCGAATTTPPPPPPPQADDRRPLTVEQVEQPVRDYLTLPTDRRLADGWLANQDNVPVAPVFDEEELALPPSPSCADH